ncbi:MAG: cytochrome c, class, partial [Gammaproteobacteria bacterium]|nr:cytochrome c, class [Gammaproteobacteria bacterium]
MFVSLWVLPRTAASASFHDAPAEAGHLANPYAGRADSAPAGGALYAQHCAACHGRSAEGSGNIPALAHSAVQSAADGEVFWFITKGSIDDGMPSWASLPEQQRWQLVAYLKTLQSVPAMPAPVVSSDASAAPPPPAPFTDYRS